MKNFLILVQHCGKYHDYNTNNISQKARKKFESQLKTVLFNSHSIVPDLEVSVVS